MTNTTPKLAIVHDYLRTFGGGERVLEALIEMFPRSHLFLASNNFPPGHSLVNKILPGHLHTSWIQHFPLLRKRPLLYRPLLPLVWSSFDLSGFDLVISSSGSNLAKGVHVPLPIPHLCYCHTPPRFLYGYKTESGLSDSRFYQIATAPLRFGLKRYDYRSSQRVTHFIANSETVKRRIHLLYGRRAQVIYPPCHIPSNPPSPTNRSHYLIVSRLTRNKNLDLIIRVANRLQLPLHIIGTGKDAYHLQSLAGPTVKFFGFLSNRDRDRHLAQAKALIVAASDEDFGMTPVEAMGVGTPVIAYHSGGFRETVIDGQTGVFFHRLNEEALIHAARKFEHLKFDPLACYQQARLFSAEIFKAKMAHIVNQHLAAL